MKQPLISIIIPTYKRVNLLIKTLESIILQSYSNWECLIIDDGSEKNEFEVIKNYIVVDKRFHLYKRPSTLPKGPSSCRNYGLLNSKGKYIQFFDDDDYMYPEMLKTKICSIEESLVDVVVAPLDFFNVSTGKIEKANLIKANNLIQNYVLGNISWYVSGPMWKKDFLEEIFDVNVQTLDDWDFNLRNIYRKPKTEFLNIPLQRYNRYELNETLSTLKPFGNEKQLKSISYVYKKHYKLLKSQNLLSAELHLCIFKRLVFLLRTSLIDNNKNLSKDIFIFLLKEIPSNYKLKFIKIIFGYYTFKIFNKGYKFIRM